jgi:hypothetical protein
MILSFFNLRVITSALVFIQVCGEILESNFIEIFKEGCDVWFLGHTPDGQSLTWSWPLLASYIFIFIGIHTIPLRVQDD